jgi:hypothetical protein
MKELKTLSILNAVSLFIHIAVSYVSQTGAIGKTTVGEMSDKYPTYFTPAGITFAIWGVIYISLTAFVIFHIYHAFKSPQDHFENKTLQKIGWNFVINNLATTLWLFAWTNDLPGIALLLIFIQLITLIIIHTRLMIHNATSPIADKAFSQFPLSIYFGWISIATIANTSIFLKSINWSGIGISEPSWAITMIAIAVMITIWVINRRKNVAFGLVVIWALYGIILKSKQTDTASYEPIAMVSWGGIALLSFACLFGLIRNLKEPSLRKLTKL